MSTCIFCKIIAGEIPSQPVYASERVIAFRDVQPLAPTHILVVPRQHIATLNDFPDDPFLAHAMITAVQTITAQEGIAQPGYRVLFNTNADGGQTVFHLHWHIFGGRHLGKMIESTLSS